MDDLVVAAREAVDAAYAPYSEYAVGAALETDRGETYTGCNVEVANFSNTLHAEEVAVGSAVRAGHRAFERVAVSTARRDGQPPCGACRQTLAEFADDSLSILCDEGDAVATYTLGELLPSPIEGEDFA